REGGRPRRSQVPLRDVLRSARPARVPDLSRQAHGGGQLPHRLHRRAGRGRDARGAGGDPGGARRARGGLRRARPRLAETAMRWTRGDRSEDIEDRRGEGPTGGGGLRIGGGTGAGGGVVLAVLG